MLTFTSDLPAEAGSDPTGDGDMSLETVLLLHAIGSPIDRVQREARAAAVMMVPIPQRGIFRGVVGEDRARAIPGVTDIRITAKEGQLLEPLPEAGSYLGFIFARGDTPAAAEASVRAAHAELAFEVRPDLMVQR